MKKSWFLLIIASFLFMTPAKAFSATEPVLKPRSAISFSKYAVAKSFVPKDLYVVGLGDSLTVGVGDEQKEQGYFGRILKEMGDWKGVREVHSVNLAKKGRRSDQLLEQFEEQAIQEEVKKASIIFLTIGGNDIMRVVKRDLFQLKKHTFSKEAKQYEKRFKAIHKKIRTLNPTAILIVDGLYNPFSVLTEETEETSAIMAEWNDKIRTTLQGDQRACYVAVEDLLHSNEDLVYHTDYFHPNAIGYTKIKERMLLSIEQCDLANLSNGAFDL